MHNFLTIEEAKDTLQDTSNSATETVCLWLVCARLSITSRGLRAGNTVTALLLTAQEAVLRPANLRHSTLAITNELPIVPS